MMSARRDKGQRNERRTSGDSSPSITAPLVSTWMAFGAGNDVDVAIVVVLVEA